MAPKRRHDGQSVYDMQDHTRDKEENQTPSRPNDTTTPAQPTETDNVVDPPPAESQAAPNDGIAPLHPVYDSEGSNDGGYIDKTQAKKRDQKIRWTDANQRHLLLFGFGRKIEKAEHERIASSFKEKPTSKAVEVYLTKKRGDLKKLTVKAEICKEDETNGRLKNAENKATEEEEMAQDESFGKKPMHWSERADVQLLLFGLGRNFRQSEEGRVARQIPGRPTRRSVRDRIEELYQESLRLLLRHRIQVPTEPDQLAAISPGPTPRRLNPRPFVLEPDSHASPSPFRGPPDGLLFGPPNLYNASNDLPPDDSEFPPAVQQQRELAREVNAASQALLEANRVRDAALRRVEAAERAQAEAAAHRALEDDEDMEER